MESEKLDDLHYLVSVAGDEFNDDIGVDFTEAGIEINFTTISWDDVKAAHRKLFGEDMSK